MADLRSWFNQVDTDRTGAVDAKELQRALGLGNLHFSLQATAQMIRLHDKDGSGTISFGEFESLHQFLLSMQAAFQHFDRDRSGSLDRPEVYGALQHAGFTLDGPAFEMMFSVFDPDKTQCMSMVEYMAASIFLKQTAAVFRAFDPQQSGSVALSYDQFLYAASACR